MTTNKYIKYFWIAIIVIVILIVTLIITLKDNTVMHNINELYKTDIKDKQREIDSLNKVTITLNKTIQENIKKRNKVDVSKDISEIKKIKQDLKNLKNKPSIIIKEISPEELLEYFNNILKEK